MSQSLPRSSVAISQGATGIVLDHDSVDTWRIERGSAQALGLGSFGSRQLSLYCQCAVVEVHVLDRLRFAGAFLNPISRIIQRFSQFGPLIGRLVVITGYHSRAQD